MRRPPPGLPWLIPLLGSLAVLAAPTPDGLSLEGQRVLAVIVLAIGIRGFETLPPGVRRPARSDFGDLANQVGGRERRLLR